MVLLTTETLNIFIYLQEDVGSDIKYLLKTLVAIG